MSKAISFLAFVYLARVLGVSNFGVLEFAGSILTYMLLVADGGLEMWGTREAANTADISVLAAKVVPLRLLLASISFLILLALLPLFPHYPHLRTVLLVYGLTVFAQALNLKWVFIGQQKMVRVARGLVIGQVVFAGAVVVFVHSAVGLVWVPVFRLVGDLASTIFFGQWFHRAHGSLPFKVSRSGAGAVLRPALTIGLSLAMGLLNYNFDAVLLGFLRGQTFVAWYNAAYKLIIVGLSLPIAYFTGLFPVLSRLYVENREQFRLLVRRSVEIWLLFVVPLVLAGMFLAEPIVRLLYGSAYANSAGPLRILVWSAALVVLRWVYMDSLRSTGHQAYDVRCAIASATLNVVLNVLLIPRYGMIGAASATAIADVVWFVMSFMYFRRLVLPGEGLPSLRGPLLGGAGMGAVLWLGGSIPWPLRAGLSLLVYLAAQALFGSFSLRLPHSSAPQEQTSSADEVSRRIH